MTRWALLLVLLGAGCSAGPPPNTAPAVVVAPRAEEESDDAALPEASRATEARSSRAGLRAAAALPIDGEIDAKALVASANSQLESIADCVALIRRSDPVVESINVELLVERDGAVTPELQSPLAADVQRCLLAGLGEWRITSAGVGRALLLLTLSSDAPPP